MSKAEEIHYKAVIAADNQKPPKDYYISAHADHFNGFVEGYIEGYHQAEKELELTWEDVKAIFLLVQVEWSPNKNEEEIYQEVLKRFKEMKEKHYD